MLQARRPTHSAHDPRAGGAYHAYKEETVMDTVAPCSPLTILAVEDNPADVTTVRRVLTAHDVPYDLHVIENADHALQFFDQYAAPEPPPCPDILLLDLTLPQRNGKELLRHLKAIPACAAIRVVILTASVDPADRRETLALGADVFFEKPFHLTDFMRLGTIIKTLAVRHAPTQARGKAGRLRDERYQQLSRKSRELRQRSQALVGRMQALCARSEQLRRQAALLARKPQVSEAAYTSATCAFPLWRRGLRRGAVWSTAERHFSVRGSL